VAKGACWSCWRRWGCSMSESLERNAEALKELVREVDQSESGVLVVTYHKKRIVRVQRVAKENVLEVGDGEAR